jgi:mannose-1-phosphate guanylyltransferase
LGSGRAVKEAARAAGAEGRIVVCNGDILTNVDLAAMLAQHERAGAALSMSLAPVDDPWNFGVVAVDDDLRINHFVEKPPQGEEPSNLINAGTWIWEPAVLERIPDDESAVRDQFSERVLFPGIIAGGLRVQGFREDLWVDVGSPERYMRATRLLLERAGESSREHGLLMRGENVTIDEGAGTSGRVLLGDGVVLERGAMVAGPSVIGPGVRIGVNATVDASAIWEDSEICAGAVVAHSIVGARARIGTGARVFDAVLADGAGVDDGCVPDPGVRLEPDVVFNERAPAR